MNRLDILATAARLTGTNREADYGPPIDNLSNCAILWTAYLEARYAIEFKLTAEDVAWLNNQQKIARTFIGPVKPDTYIDAAAYSAIAGECAALEQK